MREKQHGKDIRREEAVIDAQATEELEKKKDIAFAELEKQHEQERKEIL